MNLDFPDFFNGFREGNQKNQFYMAFTSFYSSRYAHVLEMIQH